MNISFGSILIVLGVIGLIGSLVAIGLFLKSFPVEKEKLLKELEY